MALSSDTKWTIGVGASVLVGVGWAVVHLTGLQTEMERNLSEAITETEGRLTARLDRVDTRFTDDMREAERRLTEQITKLDTRLRTVEGETASLASVEASLTQTIKGSETRIAQGLKETEQRLTAEIDQIEGRLRKVEGESAALGALVKSTWTPESALWSLQAKALPGGKLAELVAGTVEPDPSLEAVKEAMSKAGGDIKWVTTPFGYSYAGGPLIEAYRAVLKDHPEIAQAYQEAVLKELGLRSGGSGESDAPSAPAPDSE